MPEVVELERLAPDPATPDIELPELALPDLVMPEAEPAEAGLPVPAPLPQALPEPASQITLQVNGTKPLKMRAELLAKGSSWSPDTPAWHELAFYRRDDAEVAVALKTFRNPGGEKGIYRAEVFRNLEEAMAWIETFDPTADLVVDLDASDRRLSATEIALRAAALRLRADAISRQFQALVGELLFAIDAGA
jgi:hypothetical protein